MLLLGYISSHQAHHHVCHPRSSSPDHSLLCASPLCKVTCSPTSPDRTSVMLAGSSVPVVSLVVTCAESVMPWPKHESTRPTSTHLPVFHARCPCRQCLPSTPSFYSQSMPWFFLQEDIDINTRCKYSRPTLLLRSIIQDTSRSTSDICRVRILHGSILCTICSSMCPNTSHAQTYKSPLH